MDTKERNENCPVKFLLMEAERKAGQAVEPWSEMQSCWAMAAGIEAARSERAMMVFMARGGCCWRRGVGPERQRFSDEGESQQRRHWRITVVVGVRCSYVVTIGRIPSDCETVGLSTASDDGGGGAVNSKTRISTSPFAAMKRLGGGGSYY